MNIKRSTTIKAPLSKVWNLVHDMKAAQEWSPWTRLDQEVQVEYASDGNSFTWSGPLSGEGNIANHEVIEHSTITRNLEFIKPWKSKASTTYSFEKISQNETKVTWTMESKLPFFLFWMKGMMEAWVGMDYERGLSMLKDLAETGTILSDLKYKTNQTVEGFDYVGFKRTCAIKDMPHLMDEDIKKVWTQIEANKTEVTNGPFTIYHKYDAARKTCTYTSGFPIKKKNQEWPSDFVQSQIPTLNTLQVTHTGPYKHLGNAWTGGMSYIKGHKLKPNKSHAPFELYVNDPSQVKPEEVQTVVCLPTK